MANTEAAADTQATREDGAKAYLVTWMEGGRPAIVFGWAATEPKVGKSCRLVDARMVIYYTKNGVVGVASEGPQAGSRISSGIAWCDTGPVLSCLPVTTKAAGVMAAYPACGA